jgi:hypothetical protein
MGGSNGGLAGSGETQKIAKSCWFLGEAGQFLRDIGT